MKKPKKSKRKRSGEREDKHITALSGELFAAAELLRRGFLTSITFGNAKAIDLLVVNSVTKRVFTVQVKAVRRKNSWLISHDKVLAEHIYVFVSLKEVGEAVEYYVVSGAKLAAEPDLFGLLDYPACPGIKQATLARLGCLDAWAIFDERASIHLSEEK